MNLQQLRTFIRIAELGSLSRASDQMRIAQPSLSRQMKLLQQEIGVPLFERHRQGMRLTHAGEELLLRVPGLIQQLDQAYADVRSLASKARGQVVFGVVPTVSYIVAGRLADRIAAEYPDISLRIVEGVSGHLIDWLQRGEVGAAIVYGPVSALHMKREALLTEDLVLVGPSNSNLDPNVPVPVAALTGLSLVLPGRPHGLRMLLESGAARANVKLSVRFEADSFRVVVELVERGLGYTALPLSAISRELEQKRLRYAPLTPPNVTRQLILGTADSARSRATQTVIDLVRQEIASMVDAGTWRAHLQFRPNRTPASATGKDRSHRPKRNPR